MVYGVHQFQAVICHYICGLDGALWPRLRVWGSGWKFRHGRIYFRIYPPHLGWILRRNCPLTVGYKFFKNCILLRCKKKLYIAKRNKMRQFYPIVRKKSQCTTQWQNDGRRCMTTVLPVNSFLSETIGSKAAVWGQLPHALPLLDYIYTWHTAGLYRIPYSSLVKTREISKQLLIVSACEQLCCRGLQIPMDNYSGMFLA